MQSSILWFTGFWFGFFGFFLGSFQKRVYAQRRNTSETADFEQDFFVFILLKSIGLFCTLRVFAFGCTLSLSSCRDLRCILIMWVEEDVIPYLSALTLALHRVKIHTNFILPIDNSFLVTLNIKNFSVRGLWSFHLKQNKPQKNLHYYHSPVISRETTLHNRHSLMSLLSGWQGCFLSSDQ